MRITVFGATGPAGRLVVEEALASGDDVVAYARSPEKLVARDRLMVLGGTLDDGDAIARAVTGCDAVLSLLGPSGRGADAEELVDGTRHIVDAMHVHGVRRLVVTATPSSPDPADPRDLRVAAMVAGVRLFLRPAYDAIVGIGEVVRSSGLEWTLVRLPLLTDGEPRASVTVRAPGVRGGLRLTRRSLARYLLARAVDRGELHRAPLISDH